MARKDAIHQMVKNALVKDGWTITAEDYEIVFEERRVFADIAAEKNIAAEKDGTKIAVEVKSFGSPSLMSEFEKALGQYTIYVNFLSVIEPERKVFMAVGETT